MADAFISYRRKPSAALAQLVQEKLKNQYGIDAYVDTTRTDGSSVQFPNRLMTAIADSPTFICILGDTTLESEWVRKEIQRAFELQKFCIPVFQESYTPPTASDDAIEYLLRFDGVHILDIKNIYIDKAIEDIAGLIKRSKAKRPFLLWASILLGITLVALAAAFLLLMNGNDDTLATPTLTQELGQVASDTPNPADNETAIAAAIREQTQLAATNTATPSHTPTPSQSATSNPTETQQPSHTPAQATATLSVDELAQATVNALSTANEANRQLTATAQAQRDTDATNTALPLTQAAQATNAISTQQAQGTRDAIAVDTRVAELQATQTTWTPTPSHTLTASATFTPTSPPTLTPTQSPRDLALAGVTRNVDWTPIEQDFDGVTMVLVPIGCFMMGSENGDTDESPISEQCIEEPFWLDRYEVTNAQYGSIGCDQYSSEPNQPRNCISWLDARTFCESRGGRLPTEAEWEYAARGPDSLTYPWGDIYTAALVIGEDDPTYGDKKTAPVGSRPEGASWVGALDMSGNVWEWVSSLYQDYPYDAMDSREDNSNNSDGRVLRGGSFNSTTNIMRAAFRYWISPDDEISYVGFRCARSY